MIAAEWRVTMQRLSRSLAELRKALGWSQQTLADRAVVSQGAISRLESGTVVNVPLHTAVVVTQALMQGSQQLYLPFAPPIQALQGFLATFDGHLVQPLDPTFLAMLKVYHSLTATQQVALVTFLEATAGLLAPAREVA